MAVFRRSCERSRLRCWSMRSRTVADVDLYRRIAVSSPISEANARQHHRHLMDRLPQAVEDAITARLGMGIDRAASDPAALQWASPPPPNWYCDETPPAVRSGWLYHLDARNVVATAWESTERGFRVRLVETSGAAGRVCLRCWRPILSARQTDFLGSTLCELAVEHDKIWMESSLARMDSSRSPFAY